MNFVPKKIAKANAPAVSNVSRRAVALGLGAGALVLAVGMPRSGLAGSAVASGSAGVQPALHGARGQAQIGRAHL